MSVALDTSISWSFRLQTWVYLAIATAGFAMGLTFKIPFVIACSVALATAITAVAIAEGWSVLSAFGTIAAALSALQIAYLLGVTASYRRRLRK